jgi:flagellar hook-basal body complex protein FliE
MATVTKSLSDDLKAYEQKKADETAGVANTSREFAELLGKMPTSFNQEYNRFFGDTSQAAMQSASKVNEQFNNGDIDKRTYDILMANLNSQVSMTVDSMTKYATMINGIEEKKAAGELSDEDLFKLSQLQEFSDLGSVSIAFDPQSYQANLIKTGEGLKGGYDIMSINQYFNGVNMKFQGQYDTSGAITSTLKNLTGVQDITTSSGKQEVGRFISTEKGKEALTNASEAMLSQPTALRGFAMANTIKDGEDTVNFEYASVPMEYYEIGGILTEAKLKELQDKNPYTFYQDKSGRFYESDKAKEVILKNAQDMLKGAADYTRVDPIQTSNFDDNIKTILNLTLIAQRSGKQIDKESLGILLAGAKGGLDFEALSSALGSGMFTDVPVKISAAELKEQQENEKALRNAIKIDEAKTYLTKNLFTVKTGFVTPDEGDEYNDLQIENLLTPLGLRFEKDDNKNVIVYNGNTAVINLGKEVTEDRLKLLKTALIAGSEDEIYALFRRSNPDYSYEGDVNVEEEFILD